MENEISSLDQELGKSLSCFQFLGISLFFRSMQSIIFLQENWLQDMENLHPLIQTKLFKPGLVADLVQRPHLVNRLNAGLHRKVTLISAPAGFGKSTLVLSWLATCERPSVWLSLDENDSDLFLFLNYLIAAIRSRYPQSCQETLALLKGERLPDPRSIAIYLVNDIVNNAESFIIAIDDYHLIQDEEIHQFMASLIKNQPEQLHLVITSRSDPTLPIPWLRASHQLTEIRATDLRFSKQEAELFFQRVVDIGIDPAVVVGLCQNAEGWIVGLRLAALSMQSGSDPAELLNSFSGGTSDFVTDYLISEVLDRQPEEIRKFLHHTCILDRFNLSLCEAVYYGFNKETGKPLVSDSVDPPVLALLSEIKRKNLFLIPLDYEQKWYRYHNLFKKMLESQLLNYFTPEQVGWLNCQASLWFREQGYLEEAIRYAIQANDVDLAVKIVEEQSQNLLNPFDRNVLERWLSILPEEFVWMRPKLQITRAWILYRQFNITVLESVLDRIERLFEEGKCSNDEKKVVGGHVQALRCVTEYLLSANYQNVLKLSEKALRQLPESDRGARSVAFAFRALSLQALGNRKLAIREMEQIISDLSPHSPAKTQAYLSLALLHLSAGDLNRMAQVTKQMFSFATENKEVNAIPAANYTSGFLHYEWDDLDAAEVYFQRVFDARYRANFMGGMGGALGLIRINQLRHQLNKSQELLDILRADLLKIMNADLLPWIEAAQAMQDMLQGDHAAALHWARSNPEVAFADKIFNTELPILIQCRILVELGTTSDLQQLQENLLQLKFELESYHFTNHLVQVLAHLALINQRLGNITKALEYIEQAVALAHPGGLVRSIVDARPLIVPLLQQLHASEVAPNYVSRLLSAFGDDKSNVPPKKPVPRTIDPDLTDLVEPLTRREEDIIRLMARGLSNQEIAESLFISPHTVRAHATNIYAKLGVNSRARAVHKARQLGVLLIER